MRAGQVVAGLRGRQAPDAVVFLRRHGVRVTESWAEVPGGRYAVRDLTEMYAVRCPRGRPVVGVVAAVWVALAVGGLGVGWLSAWVLRLGTLALLALLLGVAFLVLRANPARVVLFARTPVGVRRLFASGDLVAVNQVYRALCRARDHDAVRRQLAGEQVGTDLASCGGFKSIMDGPAYSLLAGVGALLLMTLALVVSCAHGSSQPGADLPDGTAEAAPATCEYVLASYRPRLALGAGSGGTDEISQAIAQVQCLIDDNSGYPAELDVDRPLGIDGLFGAQTHRGVLWVQRCNSLDRDGIVDHDTWDALYAPGPDCGP
jgi:hypothetical protein